MRSKSNKQAKSDSTPEKDRPNRKTITVKKNNIADNSGEPEKKVKSIIIQKNSPENSINQPFNLNLNIKGSSDSAKSNRSWPKIIINNINNNFLNRKRKNQGSSKKNTKIEQITSAKNSKKKLNDSSISKKNSQHSAISEIGKAFSPPEELIFLKNLCILLEGKDDCVSAAYLKEKEKIYVTSRKFGNSEGSKRKRGQKEFMEETLKCLLTGEIDFSITSSFIPLVESLIENLIIYSTKKEELFYKKEYKTDLINYLKSFFLKNEPKEGIEFLNLSLQLEDLAINSRIKRFVESAYKLINSQFYKETFRKNNFTVDIVYASTTGVHAELKIIDYLVKEDILKFTENKSEKKEGNILVTASKKPCKACRAVIKKLNDSFSDREIIFFRNYKEDLIYDLKIPNFLKKTTENPFSFLYDHVSSYFNTKQNSRNNYKSRSKSKDKDHSNGKKLVDNILGEFSYEKNFFNKKNSYFKKYVDEAFEKKIEKYVSLYPSFKSVLEKIIQNPNQKTVSNFADK